MPEPESSRKLKPIKWYKGLAERKGRLEAGAFLVEGERAIGQIIASSPDSIVEIVSVAEPPAFYRRYPLRTVTESQMGSICSTKTPQGIAAIVRLPVESYSDRLPAEPGSKILLLEDVQDPGNVGALIRTAAAFDFAGAVLTEKCADPFAPKVVQSTAGTVLSLWLRRTARYMGLAGELKRREYPVMAADLAGSEDPAVLTGHDRLVLALGNEASGLSKGLLDIADHRLKVPIRQQQAESLNAAACGAILMYLSCQK